MASLICEQRQGKPDVAPMITMRKHPALACIAAALLAGLLGPTGCAQYSVHAAAEEVSTVEVVRRFGPSVVGVHLTLAETNSQPGMISEEHEGNGSGFVVDEEGRIVTNFHVVAPILGEPGPGNGPLEQRPGASISVSFLDQPDQRFPVRVRGANPDFDLALLELIDPDEAPRVDPLPLGNSDEVEAGEKAIAIGSPFGLHATVTSGIVSAIERAGPGLVGIEIPFIQTDAAINPGNSGGPLFNGRGEVIGINNAILVAPMGLQAFIGVGFAVPVNLLKVSMDGLLAGGLSGVAAAIMGLHERPRLGLSGALDLDNYPEPLRRELELPRHGIVVMEVSPGGPTDKAGLEGPTGAVIVNGQSFPVGGDIITAAEGRELRRLIDLQQVVLEHDPDDELRLTVWRDGQERNVDVKLEIVPLE
jgi:serine protease Do